MFQKYRIKGIVNALQITEELITEDQMFLVMPRLRYVPDQMRVIVESGPHAGEWGTIGDWILFFDFSDGGRVITIVPDARFRDGYELVEIPEVIIKNSNCENLEIIANGVRVSFDSH